MTGVVLAVLVLVTLSYRSVVMVYTHAGGSYVVARENFGPVVAQVGAVALMIDYIVTVAVQAAAGTAAVTSAVPALEPPRHPAGHHGRRRPVVVLRQPSRVARGRPDVRLPDVLLRLLDVAGHRRRHRPRGLRRPAALRRPTSPGGVPIGTGHSILSAMAVFVLLRVVRQRRVVAHRARGDLQRGQRLSPPAGPQRPPHPGGDELHPGHPRGRRLLAGPPDPRGAVRVGIADRDLPGGPGGARRQPARARRLPDRAAGHDADPLHRGEHAVQRLPVPGQLRCLRRLSARVG